MLETKVLIAMAFSIGNEATPSISGAFAEPLFFCPLRRDIVTSLSITATLAVQQPRKRDVANAYSEHKFYGFFFFFRPISKSSHTCVGGFALN